MQAQNTLIPDVNFEQAIISLGFDTGATDGSVPTANIDTVTFLNIPSQSISDLTGIEDFTALTILSCYSNLLTSLDATQNTALTNIICSDNQINSINVTQNTALTNLNCYGNLLTSLDVTQNIVLYNLNCNNNQLVNLDITQNTTLTNLNCDENQLTNLILSQNTALIDLSCSNNQLINLDVSLNTTLYRLVCENNLLNCLNVKNGNNHNLIFSPVNNPSLTCIEVDHPSWSTSNWINNIDAGVSFNTNCNNVCSTVGVNNIEQLSDLTFYPNPTKGNISIDLGLIKSRSSITLMNILGEIVSTERFRTTNLININMDVPNGIYFLQIESDGEFFTKKIIKE